MTFETPVNLLQLRTALREFCQLDVNDPRNSDAALNRLINAAMHRFQIANPNGWPWDYAEIATSLAGSADTVSLQLGAGAGTPTKIRSVLLQHTSGLWEYPIERVTRYEALDAYPSDSETAAPKVYSLMGDVAPSSGYPVLKLVFRPKADITYNLVIGMQSPLDDLSADTDPLTADHDIGQWSSAVLDYAAFLVWRAREALAEAMLGAKTQFDEEVKDLRRSSRSTLGPGIGSRPVADRPYS